MTYDRMPAATVLTPPSGYQSGYQGGYPGTYEGGAYEGGYSQLSTPTDLRLHELAYQAYYRDRGQDGATPRTGVRRPRVLGLGVLVGVTAACSSLTSQLLALLQGQAAILASVERQLPPGAAAAHPQLVQNAVDGAFRALQDRAMLAAGLAGLVVVLTMFSLRAGRTTRIATACAMAVSGFVLVVSVLGVFPMPARAAGVAAIMLYPLAAAMLFMPSVGRYSGERARPGREVGASMVSGPSTATAVGG